jgi:pyrroloquinoline quinone biosynthesis protein B
MPSEPFDLLGSSGGSLHATLFPVPGKVPLFLEDENGSFESDENVSGVEVSDGRRRMIYIPGCAGITEAIRARIAGADVVFFDGTLWQDEEMISAGLGPKTGRRMGHIPIEGAGGTLAAFADIPVGRKILIHINNSNPILDRTAPEHAILRAAGWEVACDGMEVTL